MKLRINLSRTTKILFLIFSLLTTPLFSQMNAPSMLESFVPSVAQPVLSPNGEALLFTGEDYHGLFLKSLTSNENIVISTAPGAGYRANWSFDGARIGFKLIHENGKQQPVFYDIRTANIVPLHAATEAAGAPTFSKNGRIAFTIGRELIILNINLQTKFTHKIDNYANLAPISPDGKNIVYNDRNDQLWIIQLESGSKRKITDEAVGFFDPKWSPAGDKILFSSIIGYLHVYDVASGKIYEIDRGSSATWKNNDEIIFCRETRDDRLRITSSQLHLCAFDGTNKIRLDTSGNGIERFSYFSPSCGMLIYLSNERMNIASFEKNKNVLIQQKDFLIQDLKSIIQQENPKPLQSQPGFEGKSGSMFDAPYIHQVYDTPDWFNGHWACGATSAMMALAYYKILPVWPCNCSYPYYHQNDYGRYICEIYSFNGYTYDVGGYDPNYTTAWGGYGFIIQNNWSDTKGYMAMYARQHRLSSSVDWSPTFSKLIDEADMLCPVVILNSLTTSGHYVLGLGYNETQHSVILNDPYGNKNSGYMNYEGKNVTYDWPGYNSGHANLNIVHCLIYMQGGRDLSISPFKMADTLTVGDTIPFETIIANTGIEPVDSASISFYLSPNNYFSDNDIFLGRVMVGSFAPVDSQTFSTSIQMPDSLPSKKYALGAFIDKEEAVIETSEANNRAYKVFVLRGYPFVYGFEPTPDASLSTSRPQISVRFKDDYFGMLMDSLKLFLDGENITQQSTIAGSKISYSPAADLSPGVHIVKLEATNNPGFTTVEEWQFEIMLTGIETEKQISQNWNLNQNFPNPFNGITSIQFSVARSAFVTLEIFSINGKKIKTLVNENKSAGLHRTSWDGCDEFGNHVTSGIYFYRMKCVSFSESRRLIYLK